MKEKTFENKVFKWLSENGIYKAGTHKQDMKVDPKGWCIKFWGGGMSASGIPDILCNINGYFVALELKGTDGRPSKLQEINIDAINKSNGLGMIVYPKDFEDMKNEIRRLL